MTFFVFGKIAAIFCIVICCFILFQCIIDYFGWFMFQLNQNFATNIAAMIECYNNIVTLGKYEKLKLKTCFDNSNKKPSSSVRNSKSDTLATKRFMFWLFYNFRPSPPHNISASKQPKYKQNRHLGWLSVNLSTCRGC